MPSDVPVAFFSYDREDSEFALKLAADLKAAGASVWIDRLDIKPGQWWDKSVEEALTNCPRMLVILSPAAVNSKNVMDEVSFALEEQKTVIPVLYQECRIPFRLRRVQFVDFAADYAKALQLLLGTLEVELVPATVVGDPAATAVETGAISHDSGRAAAAVAEEVATESGAADEKARQDEVERERLAEQTRLDDERTQAAAEQARLEKEERERKAAEEAARQQEFERQRCAAVEARLEEEHKQAEAKRARLEQQERERKDAEEEARLEQLERQRTAEKARLEEERKQAEAEKARLEQRERERIAAGEKARKEELERQRQLAAEQARQEEGSKQAAEKAGLVEEGQRKSALVPPPALSRFVMSAFVCTIGWAFCLYLWFWLMQGIFIGFEYRPTDIGDFFIMTVVGGLCYVLGATVTAATVKTAGLWHDWRPVLFFACGWAAIVCILVSLMCWMPAEFHFVTVVALAGAAVGYVALRIPPFSRLFDNSRRTRIAIPLALALSWCLGGLAFVWYFRYLWWGAAYLGRGRGWYYFWSATRNIIAYGEFDMATFVFFWGLVTISGPCMATLWYMRQSNLAFGSEDAKPRQEELGLQHLAAGQGRVDPGQSAEKSVIPPHQLPGLRHFVVSGMLLDVGWALCLYSSFANVNHWWRRGDVGLLGAVFVGCAICFLAGTALTVVAIRLSGFWSGWREGLPFACGCASTVSVFVFIMCFLPLTFAYAAVIALAGALTGALALQVPPFSRLFDNSRRTRIVIPLVLALGWLLAQLFLGIGYALLFGAVRAYTRGYALTIVFYFLRVDMYRLDQSLGYISSWSAWGIPVIYLLVGALCAVFPCMAALWYIHNSQGATRSATQ